MFLTFLDTTVKKCDSVAVRHALTAKYGDLDVVISRNYLRIRCRNAAEKDQLLAIENLGTYKVRVTEPRAITRSREGKRQRLTQKVITGVPLGVSDDTVVSELATPSGSTNRMAVW